MSKITGTVPEHKTNILPLRWTVNFMNCYVSGPFLTKAIKASDKAHYFNRDLSRYGRFMWWMYSVLNKPYDKWGTTHRVIFDKE